ncbi:MAG: hypothetical protein KAH24_03975, partial [Holophagae bacterium]|nr:hypothetical protein [Holophagae bacterium]
PMPLVARKRPPVLPMARDFSNKPGTFYVQDCYIGTNMKGIKRGDVKYLRVVESPEKRTWTNQMWGGQGTIAPGINWHDFSNKKVMGVVPVEEDGSAFFECPADTFVFFQLLDKNGKMLQTMRTGTIIQTGETQGCIGCHDDRAKPPVVSGKQMALQRAPSKLNGWYGPVRFYNYQKEMQPVWDKHCISCHDYGKKAEKHVNLSGDKTLFFNTSYTELWKRKLITCVGGGPAEILEPRTWGSFPSKLTKALEKGHHDVKLSKEEWDRIYTWVDLNGPYYPDYDSAYPLNLAGRSPLDHKQLKRLGELTGLNFFGMASHHGNKGAMMSFERPELSPCLKKLKKGSAEYKEALSIIQAGQENLKKKPRIEMENFIAAPYALERQEFYRQRKEHEKKVRKAIRDGEKIYDN